MLLSFRLGSVRAVFLEAAGQRKLTQAMTDHVFGDEHGVENLAVMNTEGHADKIGRDHRTARPGLDRRLGFGVLRLDDFLHQVAIHERAFFN